MTRAGIKAEPQRPERSGEPATTRQLALLRQLGKATGEVDHRQIDGLTQPEARALIGRILDRHPEERRKAWQRRRKHARAGVGLSVWAMDLERRR